MFVLVFCELRGKKQTLLNTVITSESELLTKAYEAMLGAQLETERLEQAVRNLAGT
ncbi:hypothetical protein AGMMS49953_02290 [Endomicrobiia bacterium]|nr:hypothetical protein AGMMS49953_02290 [Endomicrobiia bacterium]